MGFFDELWAKAAGASETINITEVIGGEVVSSGVAGCQATWAFAGVGVSTGLCLCCYCAWHR